MAIIETPAKTKTIAAPESLPVQFLLLPYRVCLFIRDSITARKERKAALKRMGLCMLCEEDCALLNEDFCLTCRCDQIAAP